MTIEDLVKATGAPSVEALEAEMAALGVTADELAVTPSYQESLKADFTRASALTTTQDATPAKAKRGRKPAALKATTADAATAANKAGNAQMATIAAMTNANQVQQFGQLAKELAASADEVSDAIAELVLATPGLTNSMAAQKVTAGLANAEPGFCWAAQSVGISDRLQAIKESYGETA